MACPAIDYQHTFTFYNNSENDLCVYLEHVTLSEIYSDTIPKPTYRIAGPIKKYKYLGISFNSLPNQDSVYIFVLVDIDTMHKECKVLQRYNLSLHMSELGNRGNIISYPPDKTMKDVTMYPPYR
jgi:hypothetical protein